MSTGGGSITSSRIFRFRRGQWLLGQRYYIFGILNLTPDSFSDGSPQFNDPAVQLQRAQFLIDNGADALDLGAESTRPGHTPISANEEWERLAPILKPLRTRYPDLPISVDTYKAEVAEKALAEGADIINDIWGLSLDARMAAVIKEAEAGLVCMYNDPGDPQVPVTLAMMREFFSSALKTAEAAGLASDAVVIDPGLGFRVQGDSLWNALTHLRALSGLGAGILVGHSRKRFLGDATGVAQATDRDVSTAVISALAALGGADILRVHNPAATRQALLLAEQWRAFDGQD